MIHPVHGPTPDNDPMPHQIQDPDGGNEVSWLMFGEVGQEFWHASLHDRRVGLPGTVTINAKVVLGIEDSPTLNLIGFAHTHPHWPAVPSATDERTMKAWVTCLGRPLICAIRGTDGWRVWWFLDDEGVPVEGDCEFFTLFEAEGRLVGLHPLDMIERVKP